MMTPEQYEESLDKLNLSAYMFGKKITNIGSHPIIRPSRNAVAKTYEMAHRPEFEDLMTAVSHLSGKKINPLIGAAGVSAVPDSARVCHNVGLEENPDNYLLMHAMACNSSGVIGSAICAGILWSFLV